MARFLTSLALALVLPGLAAAGPIIVFESDFDGNTGQPAFAGDADDTTGSTQVNDIVWQQAPGVSVNSNVNQLNQGAGAGFAQVQNGLNPLSNGNVIFVNDSLLRTPLSDRRGYRVEAFLGDPNFSYPLDQLVVRVDLSNAAGEQMTGMARVGYQIILPDFTVIDSGSAAKTFEVGENPYETLTFNVTGTLTGTNTYLVDVYFNSVEGSVPAYASFDGVELNAVPEPGSAVLLGLGLAGLALARRRVR